MGGIYDNDSNRRKLSCNLRRKSTSTGIRDTGMGLYQETADLMIYNIGNTLDEDEEELLSNKFSKDLLQGEVNLQKVKSKLVIEWLMLYLPFTR